MSYLYEATFSAEDHLGNVTAELDVRVEYTYEPGKAAPICRMEGRRMEPDQDAEVEITGLEIEEPVFREGLGGGWKSEYRPATKEERESLDTWLQCTIYDRLVETAGPDAYAAEQW